MRKPTKTDVENVKNTRNSHKKEKLYSLGTGFFLCEVLNHRIIFQKNASFPINTNKYYTNLNILRNFI